MLVMTVAGLVTVLSKLEDGTCGRGSGMYWVDVPFDERVGCEKVLDCGLTARADVLSANSVATVASFIVNIECFEGLVMEEVDEGANPRYTPQRLSHVGRWSH